LFFEFGLYNLVALLAGSACVFNGVLRQRSGARGR
jgi:hypothetical protein